ncbi:MAG: fluoride efflux transporter CrcB [Mediterranea sp.]|jgi:CrcB protein|nr:fluoride efflux transporter CrcB [Mediterranea sp.]
MKEIVYVFLGGGLGSVFRFLLHLFINGRGPVSGFPWSTFVINVLGCLLIGVFHTLSARFHLSAETRLFLTMGLCGGFTTFSTFSNENLFLLREGMYFALASYLVLSILLGILAVWAGAFLAGKI